MKSFICSPTRRAGSLEGCESWMNLSQGGVLVSIPTEPFGTSVASAHQIMLVPFERFYDLLQPWTCNQCKDQQEEWGVMIWIVIWAFATGWILSAKWYSRTPSSQPLPSVDATDGETYPMRSTRTMATQSMCTYRRHLATPRFDYIAPRKEDGAWEEGGETGTDR